MSDQLALPEGTETWIPLRLINSGIGSPTYDFLKYLASVLEHLKNETEYSVRMLNSLQS